MNLVTLTEPSWADLLRNMKLGEQIVVECHRPHEPRPSGYLCRTQRALNRQGKLNWLNFWTKHVTIDGRTCVATSRTPIKTDAVFPRSASIAR